MRTEYTGFWVNLSLRVFISYLAAQIKVFSDTVGHVLASHMEKKKNTIYSISLPQWIHMSSISKYENSPHPRQ